MENLLADGQVDHADFLARVDILGSLGRTALISKFGEYYRVANYRSRYTNQMVALVMGVPSLHEIFDEKYYLNLEGGILEALGRMFKGGLKLLVYPMEDEKSSELLTAKQLEVAPNLRHPYQYLIENGFIQEIEDFNRAYPKRFSPKVLAKLQTGDPARESTVPPAVARMIKARGFFSYRGSVTA